MSAAATTTRLTTKQRRAIEALAPRALGAALRGAVIALAPDDHWVTCDPDVGFNPSDERHVVRRGGLTTACGASASNLDVWHPNTSKPRCGSCLRVVVLADLDSVPATRLQSLLDVATDRGV